MVSWKLGGCSGDLVGLVERQSLVRCWLCCRRWILDGGVCGEYGVCTYLDREEKEGLIVFAVVGYLFRAVKYCMKIKEHG